MFRLKWLRDIKSQQTFIEAEWNRKHFQRCQIHVKSRHGHRWGMVAWHEKLSPRQGVEWTPAWHQMHVRTRLNSKGMWLRIWFQRELQKKRKSFSQILARCIFIAWMCCCGFWVDGHMSVMYFGFLYVPYFMLLWELAWGSSGTIARSYAMGKKRRRDEEEGEAEGHSKTSRYDTMKRDDWSDGTLATIGNTRRWCLQSFTIYSTIYTRICKILQPMVVLELRSP